MKKIALTTLVLNFLFSSDVLATHVQGADISYKHIGNNQYKVSVVLYRDCQGIYAPSFVNVHAILKSCNQNFQFSQRLEKDIVFNCFDGQTLSGSNGCELKQVCFNQLSNTRCRNQFSSYPGTQAVYYSGIISLPFNCTGWKIRYSENARNTSNNIQNSHQLDLEVEAEINNEIVNGDTIINSSSVFHNPPPSFVCIAGKVNTNYFAIDEDGDSLVHEMVTPFSSSPQTIVYSPGYSALQPVKTYPPNSIQFDRNTGQLEYTTYNSELNVIAFKVSEYRKGRLVGTSMRDFNFSHFGCVKSDLVFKPLTDVVNGLRKGDYELGTCPGANLTFRLEAENFGATSPLLKVFSPLGTLNVSYTNSGLNSFADFSFTPTLDDTGSHYIYVFVENSDCPVKNQQTISIKLSVSLGANLSLPKATYCGKPITVNVSDGGFGSWQPASDIQQLGNGSFVFSPTQNTKFVYSSSCGVDSIYIKSTNGFNAELVCDSLSCTDSVEVFLTHNATALPLTYEWIPSSISDTAFTLFLPQKDNYLACKISDSSGCEVTIEKKIEKWKFSNYATIVATPDKVKLGDKVNLQVVRNTLLECGDGSQFPLPINTQSKTIGNGISIVGNPVAYPTIYGNNVQGNHTQLLFRAKELFAALNAACIIDKVSFHIGVLNSNAILQNFTIRIGCTSVDSLTKFESINDIYFGPANYSPMSAMNTHVLTTKFVWDGISNIIIDVCSYNSTQGSANNSMRVTTTPFRSVYYAYGNYPFCGTNYELGALGNSRLFQRPNVTFHYSLPEIDFGAIYWQPDTGSNAVDNPNLVNTYSYPQTSQIYSVVIDTLGCRDTLKVNVVVDTSKISSVFNLVDSADFAIIPNPNNGKFICRLNSAFIAGADYEVLNLLGARIEYGQLTDSFSEIDVSSLAKGVYLMKVQDSNQSIVRRFVIE